MRATNPTDASLTFTWRDANSSQTGSGTAPAGTQTYFPVADGGSPHTIVITFSNGVSKPKATNRVPCQGTATVTKRVAGTAPAGASCPSRSPAATAWCAASR